jgi:hypothetical protein
LQKKNAKSQKLGKKLLTILLPLITTTRLAEEGPSGPEVPAEGPTTGDGEIDESFTGKK